MAASTISRSGRKGDEKGFLFGGGGGGLGWGLSSIFHMTADTIDLNDTHPSVFHINQEKFQIQQFD